MMETREAEGFDLFDQILAVKQIKDKGRVGLTDRSMRSLGDFKWQDI